MKDFLASFVNSNGVAFPLTAAVNSSGGGATDGTEFVKILVDDIWGFQQALLNYTDDTPNGVSEVGASQQLTSLQKMRAYITTMTSSTTHTVEDWNRKSILILDTGCATARIVGGTGCNRSNKIVVYNKIAGTVNIDFGAVATQEVLVMQKDQWIEFFYDDTLTKFIFQRSNRDIIVNVTVDTTIGDWYPSGTTFVCNPNTVAQYGLLTVTLPTLADNVGKKYNFIYGSAGGTYGGLVKIDGEGAETISLSGDAIPFIYLYMTGNKATINNDGIWFLKEKEIFLQTNMINWTTWTSIAPGLCKINYDTKSAATPLLVGTTVIETGGNVNKGIVIYDSAPAGAAGYILIYNCAATTAAGQGVWANMAVMTFSNGVTAAVDQGTGSNINTASVLYDGIGLPIFKKRYTIHWNTSNDMNTAFLLKDVYTNISSGIGFNINGVDGNSSIIIGGVTAFGMISGNVIETDNAFISFRIEIG